MPFLAPQFIRLFGIFPPGRSTLCMYILHPKKYFFVRLSTRLANKHFHLSLSNINLTYIGIFEGDKNRSFATKCIIKFNVPKNKLVEKIELRIPILSRNRWLRFSTGDAYKKRTFWSIDNGNKLLETSYSNFSFFLWNQFFFGFIRF